MVWGANILAECGVPLYFWTFTCRGRDLDMETADDNYYGWTNSALTNLRQQARREGSFWAYVQVTERQQRGAAHSHFIHTFTPPDSKEFQNERGYVAVKSDSFLAAVVASGLGPQCEITRVETPLAVAAYISGYLKKHAHQDEFPKGWKRVRWSREWPKVPEKKPDWSVIIFGRKDWDACDKQHVQFVPENDAIGEMARRHMVNVW